MQTTSWAACKEAALEATIKTCVFSLLAGKCSIERRNKQNPCFVIHSFCKKDDHNKENLFNSINYDVAAKKRKKDLLNNKAKTQCKNFFGLLLKQKFLQKNGKCFISVFCTAHEEPSRVLKGFVPVFDLSRGLGCSLT